MNRFIFRLPLLACLTATVAFAQNPVTTNNIGAQNGSAGGAPVTTDLRSHFAMDGVTTPIVRFDTVLGDFDVELLEQFAPNHVTNFLRYTDEERYDNTIVHRIAAFTTNEDAVVQGGGFQAVSNLESVATFDPVALEYDLPNTRGTIAAARTNDINSATSQWFINTQDNSTTLGPGNNSGFTAYGRVLGGGMDVVDLIGSINTFPLGGAFNEIPLRFYSGGDVTLENLVTINTVRRVDLYPSGGDTASVLTFTATSADPSIATAAINGSVLSITPLTAGNTTITVEASDVTGLSVSQEIAFSVGGASITSQPSSVDVAAGGDAALTLAASSTSPITYQWYRQRTSEITAQALAGATGATLNLTNLSESDMGFYWAVITSGGLETKSDVAIVTLSGGTSRLANLSTRGRIPAGGSLTPGFVTRGDGNKSLVVRAVGPRLLDFEVLTALADPTMEVIPAGGSTPIATNDNWGDASNAADLVTTSIALGAFSLNAGSADAALLAELPLPNASNSRGYTVRIKSTDTSSSGIALAEVYDPDPVVSPIQLTNVSALGFSGSGEDVLVPGFVIDGTGAKTMLIRVAGPSLIDFNVPNTMADPKLSLFPANSTEPIAANDNWGGTTVLKDAFSKTGAFSFSSDTSGDAAILVRLPPGAYTVKPEGADGGTGTILVEAYEVLD
ncbi:MAG: hypothetical protein SynsKO_10870 [Synoicihabitans sp.]